MRETSDCVIFVCFSSSDGQAVRLVDCWLQHFIMAAKLFTLLIAFALFQQALQCHYSCSSCADNNYSSCTSCANQEALLKPDGYSSSLIGACADLNISNANIFGFFLLLFMAATWIAFPSEEMIHIAILVQSLGLLYLVDILWSK